MFRIHEAKCQVCGKKYIQYRKTQKYCSDKCRAKIIANFSARTKQKPKKKVCPVCGKKFSTNIGTKKYCSTECYLAQKEKKYVAKEKTEHICAECGKVFLSAHYMQKYCCHECYVASARKRQQGE